MGTGKAIVIPVPTFAGIATIKQTKIFPRERVRSVQKQDSIWERAIEEKFYGYSN